MSMLPKQIAGRAKFAPQIDDLAGEWNAQGRSHFAQCSEALTAYYESEKPFRWGDDPRPLDKAKAVLSEVITLNEQGEWQSARARFDPAHEPFIPILGEQAQSISCVTVLGPDTCVLRLGTEYQSSNAIHISDGQVTLLDDVLAVAASRNHAWLVVVQSDGFHIKQSWGGEDHAILPWPLNATRLNNLRISDNGCRIAFARDDLGVWLGDVAMGAWRRFHPTDESLEELRLEYEEPDYEWSSSMVHCDLSPNGQYLAFGTQDYGHDVYRIDDGLGDQSWCSVCPDIDYPHNACFSDDGQYLALNGCHFYNGITLSIDVLASQGFIKPDYDPDPHTTAIDHMLRVYASTWLPAEATGLDTGAFVLAGSGVMTAVTPAGTVLFSQYFGSSASSIDYCHRSRRLFLGSYSGILHVFDIDKLATPEQAFGYKPRRELYRWTFWKDYPAFRW